jgi:hypothetical protein
MEVIYEDNHLIAVNKTCREIVQGDKTGDTPLSEILKAWLKEKYAKPGNVFVGVAHRLDRPVSGLVLFAKTSKALARLNEMFRTGEAPYWSWQTIPIPKPDDTDDVPHQQRHFPVWHTSPSTKPLISPRVEYHRFYRLEQFPCRSYLQQSDDYLRR